MDKRFPNREHAAAHIEAQRKALAAIGQIRKDCITIEGMIFRAGDPDRVVLEGADMAGLQVSVRRLSEAIERLNTLREVRDWHKADKAEQDQHMIRLVTGESEDGIEETQVFMFNRVTDGETYVGAVRDEEDYLTWKPADITMERKEGA